MRRFWLFFLASPVFAVNPVITPSTPIVNQGGTIQFSETQSEAGSWSCSATTSTGAVIGCLGSINSAGLYTAPSSITAQHVYGGMQIGPNSSIYNVRIDTAPVHSLSGSYMTAINSIGLSPSYATDFPINYVTSANTDSMNFHYNTSNNGTFEVPVFPTARAEHGWFNALEGNTPNDHHVVMVDTITGTLSEFYQYFPNCITTAASVTNNVATLTCSKNPKNNEFMVGSSITVGGFTGGDTFFNVTNVAMTSVTTTSISYALTHANATASTNGSASKDTTDTTGLRNAASGISYSSMTTLLPANGGTDAAGMELQPFILGLQELERANNSGGTINHAMRSTFALGIEASSFIWPATAFATDGGTVPFGARLRLQSSVNISTYSSIAQVLLKNLQQYGTFNTDGGINYTQNAEFTRWPKPYYDALAEVARATIAGNMEVVDESGLMLSTSSALSTNNRELVKFTRTSDNATATQDVLLMGPAVNFQNDVMYFMAGTPGVQIPVLNNYGGFSCTMSPSTGTLTTGCVYTPPSNVTAVTTTTVTATSLVNSSMTAIMALSVFPSTAIFVIPSRTADYVDTLGNTWTSRSGMSLTPDNQGCCSCDNAGNFSGTDVHLWDCAVGNSSALPMDTHLDFEVPNGTYQVVYHYGTQSATGAQFIKYSLGSTEINYNFDPSASAGGQFKNFTSTNTAVTNNLLQVGIWDMNSLGAPISSLSVVLISSSTLSNASSTESWNGPIKAKGAVTIK